LNVNIKVNDQEALTKAKVFAKTKSLNFKEIYNSYPELKIIHLPEGIGYVLAYCYQPKTESVETIAVLASNGNIKFRSCYKCDLREKRGLIPD